MNKTKINIKSKTKNKTQKNRIFTDNDYNAPDGMLTSIWGPPFWHILHTISFNYPVEPTEEQKIHYSDFILNLQNILPCKYCRMNLVTNFKNLPLTMDNMKNRDSFSRYIFNLHELVNKMLNKNSGLTYEDVREKYEFFRARCLLSKSEKIKAKLLNKTKKKEKGCVKPLYGIKSKCILKIIPHTQKCETFQIDKKCVVKR